MQDRIAPIPLPERVGNPDARARDSTCQAGLSRGICQLDDFWVVERRMLQEVPNYRASQHLSPKHLNHVEFETMQKMFACLLLS